MLIEVDGSPVVDVASAIDAAAAVSDDAIVFVSVGDQKNQQHQQKQWQQHHQS